MKFKSILKMNYHLAYDYLKFIELSQDYLKDININVKKNVIFLITDLVDYVISHLWDQFHSNKFGDYQNPFIVHRHIKLHPTI